jgi:predicted adenylyl cyclase CyaB
MKQFEVEAKFICSKTDMKLFSSKFTFENEKKFTDIYFDTKDYFLTKQDFWLRKRDDFFELKKRIGASELRKVTSYEEITKNKEIENHLNQIFQKEKTLDEYLQEFEPFASIETIRKKYKFNEFTIDVDSTNFGSNFGEIELIVQDENEIEKAKAKIEEFFREYQLKRDKLGKVAKYILENNPIQTEILMKLFPNLSKN